MEEALGYDRRPLLLAAAVVALLMAVGAIDYARTADAVPEPPPPGASPAEFEARIDRAYELEADLEARAWAYGAIAFLAALVGAGLSLRRNPRERDREVFTDLGVGAVLWLLIGFGLNLAAGDDLVAPPSQPLYYPAIGLSVIAAAGTLLTRRARAEGPRFVRVVRWLGLGATAAAVGFAWIGMSTGPDPCATTAAGAGVETLVGLSMLTAAIAVVFGFASLFQRRWIAALVMLVVGPPAALLALFTSACWN
jgi:hypothetical protein